MLNYKEIGEILSLINSSSCDELVLETDSVKLVVRRNTGGANSPASLPVTATSDLLKDQSAGSSQKTAAAPASKANPASKSTPSSAEAGLVSAPMVGTFYRAPSPDGPVFVDIGSKVEIGDPLCVIEVMKLFTTIHAESSGTVKEIGAEDAQLVEYGQMIFVIEPD